MPIFTRHLSSAAGPCPAHILCGGGLYHIESVFEQRAVKITIIISRQEVAVINSFILNAKTIVCAGIEHRHCVGVCVCVLIRDRCDTHFDTL